MSNDAYAWRRFYTVWRGKSPEASWPDRGPEELERIREGMVRAIADAPRRIVFPVRSGPWRKAGFPARKR